MQARHKNGQHVALVDPLLALAAIELRQSDIASWQRWGRPESCLCNAFCCVKTVVPSSSSPDKYFLFSLAPFFWAWFRSMIVTLGFGLCSISHNDNCTHHHKDQVQSLSHGSGTVTITWTRCRGQIQSASRGQVQQRHKDHSQPNQFQSLSHGQGAAIVTATGGYRHHQLNW